MHRIDNSTAVAALPAPLPVGTPGFFTRGNDPTGLAATRVDDNWLNTVQEEIANVVLAAGLQLSKVSNTQLYEAIQAIAYGANPDLSAYLPLSGGTLANPGNLNVGGALNVSNAVNVTAPLHANYVGVRGDIAIDGEMWSASVRCDGAAAFTGNILSSGNLTVSSNLYVSGDGFFDRIITVLGNAQIGTVNSGVGSVFVEGVVDAKGNSTFRADLIVGGNFIVHGIPFANQAGFSTPAPLASADYTPGLDTVLQLRPVSFKSPLGDDPPLCYGFVADEIATILPEMIGPPMMLRDPADTIATVNTAPLIYVLVNAVKELADRVEALERRPAPLPA